MTISDMHLSINQGLQKIASYQVDVFLPQELDLEINKNIARFVAQRYAKHSNIKQQGFEESQKRIDDLGTLVVEQSSPTTYKVQIAPKHHIDTFPLPVPLSNPAIGNNDYLHLLNVRALIQHSGCKEVNWEHEYSLIACACSNPALLSESLCVNGGNTWSCTYDTSTYRIIGLYERDENGDYIYETDSDGFSVPIFDTNAINITSSGRYVQHDDVFALLQDPFNTTKYTKPLYSIIANNLDMYTDNSFIVNKVKITYLRFPVTVMFMGGIDCDLPLHTHQEIVDMTINSLLEAISDPRYQTQSAEVLKSE